MSPTPSPLPHRALPCPECRLAHVGGAARIGNRRSQCRTCNRFVQAVRRNALSRLQAMHEEDWDRIRLEAEVEVYRKVKDDFDREYEAAVRGGLSW